MSGAVDMFLAALAGGVAGWLHFRSLRTVAGMLASGRLAAAVLQAARLAGLALFLWLCARTGPAPLLAATAGVMAGRAAVLRRAGAEAP